MNPDKTTKHNQSIKSSLFLIIIFCSLVCFQPKQNISQSVAENKIQIILIQVLWDIQSGKAIKIDWIYRLQKSCHFRTWNAQAPDQYSTVNLSSILWQILSIEVDNCSIIFIAQSKQTYHWLSITLLITQKKFLATLSYAKATIKADSTLFRSSSSLVFSLIKLPTHWDTLTIAKTDLK